MLNLIKTENPNYILEKLVLTTSQDKQIAVPKHKVGFLHLSLTLVCMKQVLKIQLIVPKSISGSPTTFKICYFCYFSHSLEILGQTFLHFTIFPERFKISTVFLFFFHFFSSFLTFYYHKTMHILELKHTMCK